MNSTPPTETICEKGPEYSRDTLENLVCQRPLNKLLGTWEDDSRVRGYVSGHWDWRVTSPSEVIYPTYNVSGNAEEGFNGHNDDQGPLRHVFNLRSGLPSNQRNDGQLRMRLRNKIDAYMRANLNQLRNPHKFWDWGHVPGAVGTLAFGLLGGPVGYGAYKLVKWGNRKLRWESWQDETKIPRGAWTTEVVDHYDPVLGPQAFYNTDDGHFYLREGQRIQEDEDNPVAHSGAPVKHKTYVIPNNSGDVILDMFVDPLCYKMVVDVSCHDGYHNGTPGDKKGLRAKSADPFLLTAESLLNRTVDAYQQATTWERIKRIGPFGAGRLR
jgi:hypothetical protein